MGITSGGLNGCESSSGGFPAGPGWDPSTGVSTPNFVKLGAFYGV